MADGLFIMVIVSCFPSPTLFANSSIYATNRVLFVRVVKTRGKRVVLRGYEDYDTAAHLQALIQDVTLRGKKSFIMTWNGPAKLGPDNLIIFYFLFQ